MFFLETRQITADDRYEYQLHHTILITHIHSDNREAHKSFNELYLKTTAIEETVIASGRIDHELPHTIIDHTCATTVA